MRRLVLAIFSLLLAGPVAAECLDLERLGSAQGRRVDLAEMQFLDLFVSKSTGAGKATMEQYPDLPGGGIDGSHLCGLVEAVPIRDGRRVLDEPRRGELLLVMTLQLRQGLDVRRFYRRFARQISRTGQLRRVPAASYFAWRLAAKDNVSSTRVGDLIAHSGACTGLAIRAGRTLLIPVCR